MKSNEAENARKAAPRQASTRVKRRPWQQPAVGDVGDLGEILQGGGGKLSAMGADPGEVRKTMPSG